MFITFSYKSRVGDLFFLKSKDKVGFIALCCFLIGDKSIDTVEECSCVVPHCYRLSFFEGFPEQYTDSKGNTVMQTKVKKSIKPSMNENLRKIISSRWLFKGLPIQAKHESIYTEQQLPTWLCRYLEI